MANKKPLVLYYGHVKQLQPGDTITDDKSRSIAIRAHSLAERENDYVASDDIDQIKIVSSLPEDPDPNVLYMIKEE